MAEQILQLGLLGAETTLETKSRSFASTENDGYSIEGRSADKTLHVDFIARKQRFAINYGTLPESLKDILTAIYDLQITNASFLNFIYTNQAGAEVATIVKMNPPSYGAINPKNIFYYGGSTILLEEV